MPRKIILAVTAILLLCGGCALLTPILAQRYAQHQVDKAFAQIRRNSTAMVTRGPVTVDVTTWTAKVVDVAVTSPNRSTLSIDSMTFEHPASSGGRLTARKVLIEGVRIVNEGDVTIVPRLEITNYSGPADGLVATPGVGRKAYSQANIISSVSFDAARAPEIEFSVSVAGIHRKVTDAAIGKTVDGVADEVTASRVRIDAPDPRPGQPEGARALAFGMRDIRYETLSLPTLWRFYAGDGAGDRDLLFQRFHAADLALSTGVAGGGRLAFSVKDIAADGVRLKPLTFSFHAIQEGVARARSDDLLTPAELRRDLLVALDAAHAVAFDRVTLSGVKGEFASQAAGASTWSAGGVEFGAYADATLASIAIRDCEAFLADGAYGAKLARGEVDRVDAAAFAQYLSRIGRDEILLTNTPSIEETIKISPRVAGFDGDGGWLKAPAGEITVAAAKAEIDAPRDMVPQKLALSLDGMEAVPVAGGALAGELSDVGVDRLRGKARISLALDPNSSQLKLEALNADFDGLGALRVSGGLSSVDPSLAMMRGAQLFDKLSKVELMPFRATATDRGAVATLIEREAAKRKQAPDAFRAELATNSEALIAKVFGPTANGSAAMLSSFIRDPRGVEIKVYPKTSGMTLLEFLSSLELGPAGIAQTIDVTILERR